MTTPPLTSPVPDAAPSDAAPAAPVPTPEQAAGARIAEFYDNPDRAAAAGDDDLDDLDDDRDYDNISYRDGKKLEAELKADREKWRPYRETFETMHPTDADAIMQTVALMRSDPAAAAEQFRRFAEILGGGVQVSPPGTDAAQSPTSGVTAPAAEAPDAEPDRPLTRAELDAEFDRREHDRAQAQATEQITAEIRALGYDPDASVDTDEYLEFAQFLAVAQALDGDLNAAHERMGQLGQKRVDRYVEAKRADARRPAAAGAQGTGPSTERVLETIADAEASMNARLDSAFGPPRRRR